MPVSVTSMRQRGARRSSRGALAPETLMWPSCVNLTALPMRFITIWRRRPGRARTITGTSVLDVDDEFDALDGGLQRRGRHGLVHHVR